MRIAQLTTGYTPQRGGMETVSSLLAREFARLGHLSVVLTRTRANDSSSSDVSVFRAPSPWTLWRELSRADAVILHGVPQRLAWPLALLRRRSVIVQHMWTRPTSSRLSTLIAKNLPTVCVSDYLQSVNGVSGDVLPNPYDHELFNECPGAVRDLDLIFMGRITRDKGVHEFVELVKTLAAERPGLTATVVGGGPELPAAMERVREAELTARVRFTGELAPPQAAAELRRHRLFVFPALWDEPFGIVALEAIACGAAVVGYNSGGIGEAVGPCGVLVSAGDRVALTAATKRLLDCENERRLLLLSSSRHLQRHRADAVATHYLAYLRNAPNGSR